MAYRAPLLIREAMTAAGLSLRELARRSGLPVGTMGMTMTGKRPLPLLAVHKVATALGMKPAAARRLALAAIEDHGGVEIVELLR